MNNKPTQPGGGRTTLGGVKFAFATIGRLLVTFIMVGIITGCIVASVLTVYILNYIGATDEINLENEKLGYTSIIYAYDKEGNPYPLQNLYIPDNNRIWVDYADISQYAKQAVVAIEDKRYWEHEGVDWKRTVGAGLNMFVPGTVTGGGSTITQQLIKNITGDDDERVDRKVREIFRAVNLSQRYSKERVLEAYLNVVPFGAGTNGIESASMVYFGKSAKDLDLAEASAIVGITQKPSAHNPFVHPEANKNRQLHVLSEMLSQGLITQAEHDKASKQELNFQKEAYQDSTAEIQTYFTDHVIDQVLKDLQEHKGWTASYAFEQLYKGGYRIYTTVDPEMQEFLEAFYLNSDQFPPVRNAEYPESCATITDVNGKMLAVVGHVGEKIGNRMLNRATMSTRQPGSSLKPLAPYAVGFEYDQITWSTMIDDSPLSKAAGGNASETWPSNWYNNYKGPVTVAYAVQQSVNTVAVKVVQTVKPTTVYTFLHDRLNFHSLIESTVINGGTRSDIDLAPMGLGALTYGVTPLEMAGGYQIYANGGTFTTPYCYTKVEDAEGRLILEADTTPRRVISEDTSVLMNKVLQLVTSQGTGTGARLDNMPTAGKTGTSEHDVDQWFLGITPYYVGQVWMGYDITTQRNEYGGVSYSSILYNNYPTPILWKKLMAPIHEGLEYKQFPESENVVSRAYCTISGDMAAPGCPTASGWYKKTNLPHTCRIDHAQAAVERPDSGAASSADPGDRTSPPVTAPSDDTV